MSYPHFMQSTVLHVLLHALQQPHISFPSGGTATEEIALRWLHIVFGIIWIGLLYFFNLVGVPLMGSLDPAVRTKIYAPLMSRAMSWFRWSAMVTVLVGLRYFTIILKADAVNAGRPSLLWTWFGEWLGIWLVAYVIIYALQMPWGGAINQRALRGALIAIVVIAASFVALLQRRAVLLKQPSLDQHRRRAGPGDVDERVGDSLARAKATHSVESRRR